ncbi:hypothetical protein LVY72_06360 [Arthrobacter sp. I2-34]|uniref:Uncharacterized protein n=1 Tax=Arthrobacter hankyongi TaxID=2904801 RepID=A0ABS9L4C7_9MICC|nr:hypothetical protein [Arthrobacter hankyongi]MCG2621537.1 hypothetical protein [Arthrobacter hankyongi]
MSYEFSNDAADQAAPARPRAGTIVWGLVAIAVGLLVLAGLWWNISFNLGYVLIALLIGSGAALVGAGIVSLIRGRAGGAGRIGYDDTESRI